MGETDTGGRPQPSQRDPGQREPDRDADAGDAPASPNGIEELPPDLLEALRQIGATGRASLGAAGDTAKAMRALVAADISLARSALGRTLAFSGIAIAAGASAWLLLMTALVVFLSRQLGMSWLTSLLIPALLSLVAAALGSWLAMRYFEHTRLQATRRQLARLGIGELAEVMPDADSPGSAREAAKRHPDAAKLDKSKTSAGAT